MLLCLQGRQQRPGLLQVGRVKALGEPGVDGRQQLAGGITLTLALPQTCEALGGSQLPGFGLLALGYRNGLMETDFGFSLIL